MDVYTKAEVDSLRSAFDAMEYKGVVSNTPSGSQIKIGYTWKASSKFNISQKDRNDETKTETLNVNVGDLIIANVRPGKTEESTGYLSSANIYWEVVPSGNEDTTYTVETLAYGIEIKETPLGGASTPIGSISIKGDANVDSNNDGDEDDVGVITVTSAAQDSDQNLTVSHKKANRIDAGKTTQSVNNPAKTTKSTVSTQVITVIDAGVENTQNGIETDEYGHVKKVHTKAFTIHDTNAELTNVKTQAAVSNSAMAAITVGATLTRSDNDEDSLNDSVYLESNNENIQLSVGSAATKSIAFSLVWGSFDTPAGDMTIN